MEGTLEDPGGDAHPREGPPGGPPPRGDYDHLGNMTKRIKDYGKQKRSLKKIVLLDI